MYAPCLRSDIALTLLRFFAIRVLGARRFWRADSQGRGIAGSRQPTPVRPTHRGPELSPTPQCLEFESSQTLVHLSGGSPGGHRRVLEIPSRPDVSSSWCTSSVSPTRRPLSAWIGTPATRCAASPSGPVSPRGCRNAAALATTFRRRRRLIHHTV